jgi:hypothetical protein
MEGQSVVLRNEFFRDVIAPDRVLREDVQFNPAIPTTLSFNPLLDSSIFGLIKYRNTVKDLHYGDIFWKIPLRTGERPMIKPKTLLIGLAVAIFAVGCGAYFYYVSMRPGRIFRAIYRGDVVALKREYKTPETIYSKEKSTPLIAAVISQHPEGVRYLLSIGEDPNQGDKLGRAALVEAATFLKEVLPDLIKAGALVDPVDHITGFTPLIIASGSQRPGEAVRVLLEAGANPNAASNKDGTTPLMRACQVGNAETARLLIERGASLDAVDKDGKSVEYYATKSKSPAVRELVRKTLHRFQDLDTPRRTATTHSLYLVPIATNQLVQASSDHSALFAIAVRIPR